MRFTVTALALLIATPVQAKDYGAWSVSFGQGYLEHSVSNGPGNTFIVSCDEGATVDHSNTSILVTILGKPQPANTTVTIVLDGKEVKMYSDETGSIETQSHAGSGQFDSLWDKMRHAKTMLVQLADGRSSTFPLNGARQAFEPTPCRTGYSG